MRKVSLFFAVSVTLLLVLFPLAAGCLSVPGPESAKKTTPVTAAVTRSSQATAVPPAQTAGVQSPVPTTAPAVTTTVSAGVETPGKEGYAAATCEDLGGFLVVPGETCSGTWLPATNTFSCCSARPARAAGTNKTISAAPFSMTVNIDDSLGSITP